MKPLYIIVLACFFAFAANAQNESFVLKNVTIHQGNGKVIEKAAIAVKDGKIDAIGAEVNENKYKKVLDGNGQHIYPGFIALNTQLGLVEVEAVRATRDFREIGRFNPNVRSIIAYNTDSDIIPTIRSNGVMMAQIVPQGGRMSGQSSLVKLEAYNWEDATVAQDNAIHLNWPNRYSFSGWWAAPGPTEENEKYSQDIDDIKLYFDAAMAYTKIKDPETTNVRFEAMKKLFNKTTKLFVHVDDAKSMIEAHDLLSKYGVKLVYVGAEEAWRITDFLKENDIEVVLGQIHSLPRLEHSDIDQPFKTPAQLYEAGITFAISMDGSWNQRNIMFQAGQTVTYGLPKEQALAAITLNAAKIMGVDDRLGSLEKGKEATFIVSKGDALDMRTSVITDAYINGQQTSLEDKQKELYRKYLDKYGLD